MAVTASTPVAIPSSYMGYGYGYDPMRDTLFGVPVRDFQRMRPDEQRHYVQRWQRNHEYEELVRRGYAYEKYNGKIAPDVKPESFADAVKPLFDQSWKTNTKLLLMEN